MPTLKRTTVFSLAFAGLFCSLSFVPAAVAEEPAPIPAVQPTGPNRSPSLRPQTESRACKKAKKAFADIRRKKRHASPLAINEKRRAMLDACPALP